jgi:hypothetical protein
MSRSRRHNRAGQSLVEFAVVALVMYMLLAAILTFGHALYVAQGLQGAADLAAREIARTPLPATMQTLDDDGAGGDALSDNDVRARIFDDAYLVIDLDIFYGNDPAGSIFEDLVPNWPLLNQQLAPLMIVDRPIISGVQRRLLRYPGAVLTRDPATPPTGITYGPAVVTELTVGIPLINQDGSVQWVGVVEELESVTGDPFSIDSPQQGIVALRMNYPFQSASMSGYHPNPAGVFEPTIGNPIVADNSISAPVSPAGEPLASPLVQPGPPRLYAGTYGGNLGLGAQGAFGQTVRPFRRVISAQAIYRREIFE